MTDPGRFAIYIEADACPVKQEVNRVAERHGCHIYGVSNSGMVVPRHDFIERVVVPSGPDVADDWIAERAGASDVVVTADIPLASRCVKAGASVIAPNGKTFTESSIGMVLATRNLMDRLRETGEITGGPKPFSARDRSAFLGSLDRPSIASNAGSGGDNGPRARDARVERRCAAGRLHNPLRSVASLTVLAAVSVA